MAIVWLSIGNKTSFPDDFDILDSNTTSHVEAAKYSKIVISLISLLTNGLFLGIFATTNPNPIKFSITRFAIFCNYNWFYKFRVANVTHVLEIASSLNWNNLVFDNLIVPGRLFINNLQIRSNSYISAKLDCFLERWWSINNAISNKQKPVKRPI